MRVTVAFLSKKNIILNFKSVISLVTKKIKQIILICILVLALVFFSKIIKVPKELLCLATNFREYKSFDLKLKDLVSINGIFNARNYLVNKEVIQEVKSIDKTKEEILKKIDLAAENKNEVDVFALKDISYEITQETDSLQRISMANMKILNYSTKRDIDYKKLVSGVVNLTKGSDSILIYNTHTSESYANCDKYQFEYSGIRRSKDASYNMLAVANEFRENLCKKGFNVTHNTTPHDYGTYDSAYVRSRITLQDSLLKQPEIGLSIDLHRDAIENLDFRPVTNINGVDVAQCMFVIGIGYDDEANPYYEDNLKLALKLQYIADEVYPGLFRPMIIRNSVYNQDLKKYSILIEVGASGNTFDEAFYATRCLTNLLNIIYKD